MDEITKARLKQILQKDISALLASDIIFLRARRDYLTEEQEEKYAQFIKGIPKGERQYVPKDEVKKQGGLSYYQSLVREAKQKGFTVEKGTTIEDLKLMIESS